MSNNRGFDIFVGKKIVSVDADCINVVKFTFEDGETVSIDCDEQHYGIGVIQVGQYEGEE